LLVPERFGHVVVVLVAALMLMVTMQSLEYAGFPVGIQADELNWVDTFGFSISVCS